jgi:oligoendopeptidase F
MYRDFLDHWRADQVELRGYPDLFGSYLENNALSPDIGELVLDVCTQHLPLYRHFLQLVARRRGRTALQRHDLNTLIQIPIADTPDFIRDWTLVLDSFWRFHPDLALAASQVRQDNHLDSAPRDTKQGVSECVSVVPDLSPWVLVNYAPTRSGVCRLAHELGHAVHHMAAAGQSVLTYEAPSVLSETVALFSELLVLDRVPIESYGVDARPDVLIDRIADLLAGLMEQLRFLRFEFLATSAEGRDMSAEQLADAYLDDLRRQFGEIVIVPDELRWEWLHIPQFFGVPHYVFSYIFGQLVALALHRAYRLDPAGFPPRYLTMLSAGGTRPPHELLLDVGVDISRRETWDDAFAVLDEHIHDLETLLQNT